jgi:hypothetical protein
VTALARILSSFATWALTHRLRFAFGSAVASIGSGVVAVATTPWRGALVLATLVAVPTALLFVWLWLRGAGPPGAGSVGWRVGRFLALMVLSSAALVGGLLGVAVVVGRLLADRVERVDYRLMWVGLAVVFFVLGTLLSWWFRSFQRTVIGGRSRLWITATLTVVTLTAGLVWLTSREPSFEMNRDDRMQAREAGLGQYDLLLVIDPADAVSQQLIEMARHDVASGNVNGPFPPALQGTTRYSVAYGLAVPEPRDGRRPLWRLVEPPTLDTIELTESLARIPIRDRRPASASYGRLLVDVLEDRRVRWRNGAQRGVAFLLEDLPTLGELDGYMGRVGDAISEWADSTVACPDFLAGRAEPSLGDDQSVPVGWGDALAVHCKRRIAYREWAERGRRAGSRPPPPVAVHALTGETRRARDAPWWTWIRALDGVFHRPVLNAGPTPDTSTADADQLLHDARELHIGAPVGDLPDLAMTYRPHLFFDTDENFFPLDVDWLLSETGEHEICDRKSGPDNCESFSGHLGLAGALDEAIDFRGGGRLDLVAGENGPPRMYVHVRAANGRLYLGYWWFFRFNTSPWRTQVNCLPGLTLGGLTCHDHEGDWEGVTVVLRLDRTRVLPDPYYLQNLIPEAVIYDTHGHPVQWPWEDVELVADPGHYATHPAVYVAAGSHASYPVSCQRKECNQKLANSGLGDGGFDGAKVWRQNERNRCIPEPLDGEPRRGPCLLALPSTRDGSLGVLWNAFPGRWGKAVCTRIAKVCSQVDGPRSPSFQSRFREPWNAVRGPRAELLRLRRIGKSHATSAPRWPPRPWPTPEGETAPGDTTLPDRARS